MLSTQPGKQSASELAATEASLGAIKLAGSINAFLSATLPYALKLDKKTGEVLPKTHERGACSDASYRMLKGAVDAAKAGIRGVCQPIPKKVFSAGGGTVIKVANLAIQRSYSRLAIAREVLAQSCHPGYYGKRDHSQGRNEAIGHVRRCAAFNTVPAP